MESRKEDYVPDLKADMQNRITKAVDNFMQGYGCCQSVVAAFADLYDLDDLMA